MDDIELFGNGDFDAKKYINNLCEKRSDEVPVEKYLGESEMKLHIAAEDLSLYLHEEAFKASLRLPSAARELCRIEEDTEMVKSAIADAFRSLNTADKGTKGLLAELAELQEVKIRMESARDTLQEAAGLSSLFRTIDSMLQSNDLIRLADALQGLRRGLQIVGDSVPEFSKGPEKLENLEVRVLDMAVERLEEALRTQNGDATAQLCGILAQLEKDSLIEQFYTKVRSKPLVDLWEEYSPETPFTSWVSTFYDEVTRSVVAECDWCKSYIPEHFPSAVVNMVLVLFQRLQIPCKARLAGAISTSSISPLQSIEAMEQSIDATADFLDSLVDILTDAGCMPEDRMQRENLMIAISLPYNEALKSYPEKEAVHLNASIDNIVSTAREAVELDRRSMESVLKGRIETVFGILFESLYRCMRVSQGSSLPELMKVMDVSLAKFLSQLGNLLSSLLNSSESKEEGKAPDITPMLSWPPLMGLINQLMSKFQTEALDTITEKTKALVSLFDAPNDKKIKGPLSLAYLRILHTPELENSIRKISSQANVGLQQAGTEAENLNRLINSTIESLLLQKIDSQLSEIVRVDLGSEGKKEGEVLKFSSYPLQYMISAGEQLMLLPQLLESAWGGESLEYIPDDMVGNWIDRLSIAACERYMGHLEHLKKLSPAGAEQLGADVEYFANILSSLGQEVPENLSAWQAGLNADKSGLEVLLHNIEKADAIRILKFISRLRNFDIS